MNFPPPSEKQARVLWFALTATAVGIVLTLIGLVVWGLGWMLDRLSSVLLPIAVAMILAYILDPVVEFLMRKKVPRMRAIIVVFLVGVTLFMGLLASVVPGMVTEAQRLLNDLPENVQKFHAKMDVLREKSSHFGLPVPSFWPPRHSNEKGATQLRTRPATKPAVVETNAQTNAVEFSLNIKVKDANTNETSSTNTVVVAANTETIKRALESPFSETVMPGLAQVLVFVAKWITVQFGHVATWIEFIIGFVLVPVYLFYFLLEKKGIATRWTDYLPVHESKLKEEIIFILKAINDCLIVFFRGQVLVALCVGALLAIGYSIMGLNYAVLLAVVAALLGIVPYLGTIISLLLALTVAVIQFGDWFHPLLVLAIAAAVKLLEDFLIGPKIIGERSGLHPLTIIIAVLAGTVLFGGILGALLAIPLTAVLRTLMLRYVWKKRNI